MGLKFRLKVFVGGVGDSPRGGEMSAKLTEGTGACQAQTFFRKVPPIITYNSSI